MRRSVRVGITGKIGSGKSTLLRVMEQRGIAVINTDDLARSLMQDNAEIREKIVRLLGKDAYLDGALNRGFIASKIFADAGLRMKLEAIVHPAVTKEVETIFEQTAHGKIVAVESALILQSNFRTIFDYIVLVDISDDIAVARVSASGRLSEADVRARLAEQHWEDISRDEIDFTFSNDDTPETFELRAKAVVSMLEVVSLRPLPSEPLHSTSE